MPSDVLPAATALRAYSICTSLPDGLNVVSEKEYAPSAILAGQRSGEARKLCAQSPAR
jgi:hypothetical protein